MSDFTEIAEDAATKLAEKYSGNPELEFVTWLQIALEREAMVTKAYDDEFVDEQLAAWQRAHKIRENIAKAIRKALMNVWAQEKAHQAYFEAFLEEVCPPSTKIERLFVRLKEYRGQLQGEILGARFMRCPNMFRDCETKLSCSSARSTAILSIQPLSDTSVWSRWRVAYRRAAQLLEGLLLWWILSARVRISVTTRLCFVRLRTGHLRLQVVLLLNSALLVRLLLPRPL